MEKSASIRRNDLDLEKVFAKDWQKEILRKNFKENPYPDKQVWMNLSFF